MALGNYTSIGPPPDSRVMWLGTDNKQNRLSLTLLILLHDSTSHSALLNFHAVAQTTS